MESGNNLWYNKFYRIINFLYNILYRNFAYSARNGINVDKDIVLHLGGKQKCRICQILTKDGKIKEVRMILFHVTVIYMELCCSVHSHAIHSVYQRWGTYVLSLESQKGIKSYSQTKNLTPFWLQTLICRLPDYHNRFPQVNLTDHWSIILNNLQRKSNKENFLVRCWIKIPSF